MKATRTCKAFSESTLSKYWSRAVLKHWGYRCALCGQTDGLECHHIIRKHYRILRHDWRNGMALCHNHHTQIHTQPWLIIHKVEARVDFDYLQQMVRVKYKDYLLERGMTDAEWSHEVWSRLKEKIAE